MNIWSLPTTFTVLYCALIAGIAVVDMIPGEIESEVMVSGCNVVSNCDMFFDWSKPNLDVDTRLWLDILRETGYDLLIVNNSNI
jgi:hypothetical protein